MIPYRVILKLSVISLLVLGLFLKVINPLTMKFAINSFTPVEKIDKATLESEISKLEKRISDYNKINQRFDEIKIFDSYSAYSNFYNKAEQFNLDVENLTKNEKDESKLILSGSLSGRLRNILGLINSIENEKKLNRFDLIHIYENKDNSEIHCSFALTYYKVEVK